MAAFCLLLCFLLPWIKLATKLATKLAREVSRMAANLHYITPLYPEERTTGHLHELAAELLKSNAPDNTATSVRTALVPLLRAMNSYYTNRIEGQNTRPVDIERALHAQMDRDEQIARKQRLALAHLEAEAELEKLYLNHSNIAFTDLYSFNTISHIHRNLYEKLPPSDRITEEGEALEPGRLRDRNVQVGLHIPPEPEAIPAYMRNWQSGYADLPSGEKRLIGIAASHHRLAWIHPFLDGNGRAARLHSHLALRFTGITDGTWSVMRGLARRHDDYYRFLNNADLPRKGDTDGRGALSQAELVNFIQFFLEVCLDQSRFMHELIRLDRLKNGLQDLLLHLSVHPWKLGSESSTIKLEGLEALHYVAISGPVERGKFIAMTGLGERTGRRFLASLIDYGILASSSSRSPVEFAVPFRSLRFLFPALWPEAEADYA